MEATEWTPMDRNGKALAVGDRVERPWGGPPLRIAKLYETAKRIIVHVDGEVGPFLADPHDVLLIGTEG